MSKDYRQEAVMQLVQERFRTFTRLEKVFYLALVVTAVLMAISTVYMYGRTQQIQQEISYLNRQIHAKEEELNDAKQEVNELARLDRINEIVSKADIKTQEGNGNLQKVDTE